jgi:hypothetical protein
MVDLNTPGSIIFPPRSIPRTQCSQGFFLSSSGFWRKKVAEEIQIFLRFFGLFMGFLQQELTLAATLAVTLAVSIWLVWDAHINNIILNN